MTEIQACFKANAIPLGVDAMFLALFLVLLLWGMHLLFELLEFFVLPL